MPNIALQGCIHGDIDRCYNEIIEKKEEPHYVIWSGDVQTLRGEKDFGGLACPAKYKQLKDFPKYYSGAQDAPYLTVFIGGNHEASDFLASLPFGGWVAKKVYYLGRSNVVNLGSVRVAGLSGIYNVYHFREGYYEKPPFDHDTVRSVYHTREIDITRLAASGKVDLVLTHDWPADVVGTPRDRQILLRKKPFFEKDLDSGQLGNPFSGQLKALKPIVWAAAHLHVNFTCSYPCGDGRDIRFLSHDKPKREVATSYWISEAGKIKTPAGPQDEIDVEPIVDALPPDGLYVDAEWLLVQSRSLPFMTFARGTQNTVPLSTLQQPATEEELQSMAQRVLQQTGEDWSEAIHKIILEHGSRVSIPVLRKLFFKIPDDETLRPDDPDGQTQWWLRVFGAEATSGGGQSVPISCDALANCGDAVDRRKEPRDRLDRRRTRAARYFDCVASQGVNTCDGESRDSISPPRERAVPYHRAS